MQESRSDLVQFFETSEDLALVNGENNLEDQSVYVDGSSALKVGRKKRQNQQGNSRCQRPPVPIYIDHPETIVLPLDGTSVPLSSTQKESWVEQALAGGADPLLSTSTMQSGNRSTCTNERREKRRERPPSDSDSDSERQSIFERLQEPVKFLGIEMTRMHQLIICAVLSIVALVIISMACAYTGIDWTPQGDSAGNSQGGSAGDEGPAKPLQLPSLSGSWVIETSTLGSIGTPVSIATMPGRMHVNHYGNVIKGSGEDSLDNGRRIRFRIDGEILDGERIRFKKTYLFDSDNTRAAFSGDSKPIEFEGRLLFPEDESPMMDGIWSAERNTRGPLRHLTQVYRGEWKASMLQDGGVDGGIRAWHPAVENRQNNWSLATTFMTAAVVALLAGIAIVMGPMSKSLRSGEKFSC